jgi:hypothetical protein
VVGSGSKRQRLPRNRRQQQLGVHRAALLQPPGRHRTHRHRRCVATWVRWTANLAHSMVPVSCPPQRLSKLEAAREEAHAALVVTERQRAAEVSENTAWLSHLDDEIYRATTQLHASYKGEYTVTLAHTGADGFGMDLETGQDGVTRVTAVARHGSAAASGVVCRCPPPLTLSCGSRSLIDSRTHLHRWLVVRSWLSLGAHWSVARGRTGWCR